MPRRRTVQIIESLAALRALEKQHKGSAQAERVAFLRLLKEQPLCTLAEAARLLGRSEPTLERWLRAYRNGGLASLLEISKGGNPRPPRLHEEGIQALAHKVQVDGIRNVGDLRAWVKEEYGVEYSRQGMQYLLREKVEVRQRTINRIGEGNASIGSRANKCVEDMPGTRPSGRAGIFVENRHFSKAVVEFLNALPATHDAREWILAFRECLRKILDDVDRVSVVVDVDCDLRSSAPSRKGATIAQFFNGDNPDKIVTVDSEDLSPVERMERNLKAVNFPFDLYHPPLKFDYYFNESVYVGVIFLWREKSRAQISWSTQCLMNSLRPFVSFLLSDLVARHKHSDRTVDSMFNRSLTILDTQVDLTTRESQVLILQLFGHTYDQIADRLSLSINTVRKHVASIHRKTGTHSFTELFAKYFTPALGF